MEITPVKQVFSEMTAQLKATMKPGDYEIMLNAAEEFARVLLPMNKLAILMNAGWSVHVYHNNDAIYWEVDNKKLNIHLESDAGCTCAEEAIAEVINAIIENRIAASRARAIQSLKIN